MSGIPGSPLGFARDIAEGVAPFTALQLKKMTPADLKSVKTHLSIVLREVRTEAIGEGDVDAIRRKSQRLQRLNAALMLVENHARKLRIPL